MAILINDNYKLSANKPFDDRYLNISTPWSSCAEVIAGIPTYRYTGLTVNIAGDEYWWKDGVGDGDLVPKNLGGTSNLSGATNGLQLLCGNTYIGLGGELTQDTTICGGYDLNLGNTSSGLTSISAVTPTFHVQSANGNSHMNFSHDEDQPRYDVCLFAANANSNASIVLDVDNTNSCFIADAAPNVICKSNLSLCTTDNNTKIFNVSSTNSSLRYNNEAWISTSCQMTCESITNASTSGLNIKSVMNYANRSHSFIKDDSTILSILSGGTARYGSNVTLNNDCDLAHKWYVDNVTGNIGADNGLTRNGDNIVLGGSLTGDTCIDGNAGNYGLTISGITQFCVDSQLDNLNVISLSAPSSQIFMNGCNVCAIYGGGNLDLYDGFGVKQIELSTGGDTKFCNLNAKTSETNLLYINSSTGQIVSGGTINSTTANNGLTENNSIISLGGNLTGNTTINGLGTYDMCFDNIDNALFNNVNDLSMCSSSATTCATSEMLIRTPDFTLHNGVDNVMLITSSCNILTDTTNSEGFVYADDYSTIGSTNPRWIPDIAYVTGLTSGGTSTASNGLCKIGADIKLGGTLCENTDICLGGTTAYGFKIINSGVTTNTIGEFNSTNINLSTTNINSPFEVGKFSTTFDNTIISNGYNNCHSCIDLSKSIMNIEICGGASNASFTVTDATSTPRGIEYAGDYSSTFSNCSLVTKEYVTGITTNSITGASNGLVKNGQDVEMGGSFSKITEISGNSNWLCFGTEPSPLGIFCAYTNLLSKITNNVNGDKFLLLNNASAILQGETSTSSAKLDVHQANGIEITVSGTSNPMYYNDDYSSLYNLRSIPDVEYVSGFTIVHGTNIYTSLSSPSGLTGTNNVLFGEAVGNSLTTGKNNIGIGGDVLTNSTTGRYNIGLGSNVLNANVTGFVNIGIGNSVLASITGGSNNIGMGNQALANNVNGDYNIGIGVNTLFNTKCNYNTGVGYQALCGNEIGFMNTAIGAFAGNNNITGHSNVFLGSNAGYYETGTNKLYIDNAFRGTSLSESRTESLVYGEFNDNPSNQLFRLNSQLELPHISGCSASNILYYDDTDGSISYAVAPSGATPNTFSNGLTKTGNNVKLGGCLTEDSGLLGDGYTFQLGTTSRRLDILNINASGSTSINVGASSSGVNRTAIDMLTSEVSIQAINSSNISNNISVGQTNMMVTDAINSKGLVYADDYINNFDNCSLITKEYVDNKANVVNVCQISTAYTTLRNDELIAVSGLSNNEISLYATPELGQRLTVVDICGNALADPITVNGNGNNINDGICSTINTDYGSITYVFNGIFWSAIAFIN